MTRNEHAAAVEKWVAEAEKARPWILFHAKQQQRHFYAGDVAAMQLHSGLSDSYRRLFNLTRDLAERHQRRAGFGRDT